MTSKMNPWNWMLCSSIDLRAAFEPVGVGVETKASILINIVSIRNQDINMPLYHTSSYSINKIVH